MAVNLKRVAKDLVNEDPDIRILALTTVVQLTPGSLESREDLPVLWEGLERATQLDDPDTVFLARKGLNHLQQLMEEGPGAAPSSAPPRSRPTPPPSREEALAGLEQAADAHALANALAGLVRAGPSPDDCRLVAPHLEHADERVRANAVEVVEASGDQAQIAQLLPPLLEDPNHRVQGNANKALGAVGHPRVVETLTRMVRSGNLAEREAGVYSMSFLKGPQIVGLLIQALRDPYEGIRLRAVKALGRHKDPRCLEPLRQLLNDIDIDVCEEADRVIRFIQMESPQPVRDGFQPAAAPPAPASPAGPPEAVASPELAELRQAKAQALTSFGQRVFALLRQGTLQAASLQKPYYDVVKAQEFLRKQKERAEGGERFDFDLDQARRRTEETVRVALLQLAEGALLLAQRGELEVPGAEDVRTRLAELDQRLLEAAG